MTNPISKTDTAAVNADDIDLDLAVGSSDPFTDADLMNAEDFDLTSEMMDIEAELSALRQQFEEESSEELLSNADYTAADDAADEIALDSDLNADDDMPEEIDPFVAFTSELLAAEAKADYGVNSQDFEPEDFDVASSTAEIAPERLDEASLETIDASDLEALFGLNDDDFAPVSNHANSFLTEAAQLDEREELPKLLPETEEFSLDETPYPATTAPIQAARHYDDIELEDEPEITAKIDALFEDIALDLDDDAADDSIQTSELIENTVELDDSIDLDISSTDSTQNNQPGQHIDIIDNISLDDEPVAVAPASTAETQTQTKAVGLDLSVDDDNPMAWLDKMKNEMASKFNIDIDQEAADLSNADLSHLYDDLEEFDDKKANLGENLNALPEFDESKLNQSAAVSDEVISVDDFMTFGEEPVVKRPAAATPFTGKSVEEVLNLNKEKPQPREVDPNVSLDELFDDNQSVERKVDLTAEPLDESELELFDESMLFGDAAGGVDLEIDFGTTAQPATESVDLSEHSDDVAETKDLDLTEELVLGSDSAAAVETSVEISSRPKTESVQVQEIDLTKEMISADSAVAVETSVEIASLPETESVDLLAQSVPESNQNHSNNQNDDVFEIDLDDDVPELPAEALAEVPIEDWDDVESVSAAITEMEDLVVPKTKLMELMEAEQAQDAALHDSTAQAHEIELDAATPTDEADVPHSVLDTVTETVSEWEHGAEEWAHGMADAVKDKAQELEMRAEIVAQEVGDAIKHAGEWAEDFAGALAEKTEELEMRAEILAHEVVENAKEVLHLSDSESDSETQTDSDSDTAQPEIAATAAAATVGALSAEALEADKRGWASRLKAGLTKSRNQMAKSLAGVFGGGKIDDDLYEELETTLLISDMGIEATEQLMKEVRNRVSLKGLKDGAELRAALKDAVYDLLKPLEKPLEIPDNGQPFVIMMAGINGAGKTTSIGKLAKYFQAQGKSVMLAAGDTFRAAAREQLQEWGARNGVTVISQASGDSAAVCFDAVESAKAKGIDIVLADTAGRLPTQIHLMEEIKKVKRVLQKAMPDAPHEVMVVLDANIGQNAINQVVAFDDALGVTGLIVTKLDGTAKGGVLAALASSRPIPVRYIGVGEGIDDLRPFDARAFVDALLDE